MSLESVRFPALNHTNYVEWVLRMEAVLIRGGFWDLVTGDEKLEEENDARKKQAFKKRQDQCRAEIVLRVEDSQLPHMTGGDPKMIWDALAAVHHAQGFWKLSPTSSAVYYCYHEVQAVHGRLDWGGAFTC